AELTVHVLVERSPWQPTLSFPSRGVGARIRVDGEEIEPAVAVVVDPTDASAHHRLVVARHPEAERALPEVEAHRRGHILQAVARRDGTARCGLDLLRLGVRPECPTAFGHLVKSVGRAAEAR